MSGAVQATDRVSAAARAPFLRVPPFPGSRPKAFAIPLPAAQPEMGREEVDTLIGTVARLKVGGTYWGTQPALPNGRYVLARVRNGEALESLSPSLLEEAVVWWTDAPEAPRLLGSSSIRVVRGCCDPWHLLAGAASVIVDADDELALIAAIGGVHVQCLGSGEFARLSGGEGGRESLRESFLQHVVKYVSYLDPYTKEPIGVAQAIAHCGFWRQVIDSNRDISSAVGFAFWKRATVAPLLWAGAGEVPFAARPSPEQEKGRVALWKSRTPAAILSDLERKHVKLIEVEDGFIRSAGLGADCVPPLSIVVDRLGVHFDPRQPSELEALIQHGPFAEDLLDRARHLRELIVTSGLSKYGAGQARLQRRCPDRRHVLVPGQVEDDRSVLSGGGAITTNFELLRRAREAAPDAYIIYKPHPDVEAGHRVGAIPDERCLELADEIVRDQPISALIDLADEVHVNTSLAGFEALLRGRRVTTHGVPFYAGWGLTRDLGAVPHRRNAKRTLDELVAAVLLLYPRYLDPVTGLPCPPEILIRRLTEGAGRRSTGMLVGLRRLQGRWKRGLAAMRGR